MAIPHLRTTSVRRSRAGYPRRSEPTAWTHARDPAKGPARQTAGPAPRAEEGGFEPTDPCRSTVFETVRFGRSRTPPPAKVVDASQSVTRSGQAASAAFANRGEKRA